MKWTEEMRKSMLSVLSLMDSIPDKDFEKWLSKPGECQNCSNLKPGKAVSVSYGSNGAMNCSLCGDKIAIPVTEAPKKLAEKLCEGFFAGNQHMLSFNEYQKQWDAVAKKAVEEVERVIDGMAGRMELGSNHANQIKLELRKML